MLGAIFPDQPPGKRFHGFSLDQNGYYFDVHAGQRGEGECFLINQ
jgi:hypothetical protein